MKFTRVCIQRKISTKRKDLYKAKNKMLWDELEWKHPFRIKSKLIKKIKNKKKREKKKEEIKTLYILRKNVSLPKMIVFFLFYPLQGNFFHYSLSEKLICDSTLVKPFIELSSAPIEILFWKEKLPRKLF